VENVNLNWGFGFTGSWPSVSGDLTSPVSRSPRHANGSRRKRKRLPDMTSVSNVSSGLTQEIHFLGVQEKEHSSSTPISVSSIAKITGEDKENKVDVTSPVPGGKVRNGDIAGQRSPPKGALKVW